MFINEIPRSNVQNIIRPSIVLPLYFYTPAGKCTPAVLFPGVIKLVDRRTTFSRIGQMCNWCWRMKGIARPST